MTSITSLQFAALQIKGQDNSTKEAGGDFSALLSRVADRKEASAVDVKTYSVGNGLNIDMTAFGIGEDSDAKKTDPLMGLIDALFDQVQGKKTASQSSGPYPFTSQFESVFGTNGGPLFDFINATTASLGLSAEKNLALQNIAINNKDATRTPGSIAKIRGELQAAGIA